MFGAVTKAIKDASEGVTKTMMVTSVKNNKALAILNDKFLEIMNDRGVIAPYLLCFLSKIPNPGHTSQFELEKDLDSNNFIDLLTNKTLPVNLCENLLTFRHTDKMFEMNGVLLKMIAT